MKPLAHNLQGSNGILTTILLFLTTLILQVKTMFPLFFFLALSLLSCKFYAQITNIPDPIFEQALIDLGIDSDGIVNEQVITSDVESVVILNLNHKGIQDITGLQDFAALEILDATGNELTTLDIDNNIQLRELYCSSDSAGFNMPIST